MKTSKVGRVWEVKKRIIGGKKATIEATAVVNPHDGKLAVSRKQIKTVTLRYCKDTLGNNRPAKGFENVIKAKKDDLERKLLECEGSFKPTEETFNR